MRQNKKILFVLAIAWMLIALFFTSCQIVEAQSSPTLSLSPSTVTVNSFTDTFTVNFKISGVANLWGWSANITWDSQYIIMTKAPIEGDFLSQTGHSTTFVSAFNKTTNTLKGEVADVGLDPGAQSGDGTLASFTFQVLKPVVSTIITINATQLLSNQTSGALPLLRYDVPISPFPATTYAFATVSYIPSGGLPVPDAGLNQTVNQHTNVLLNASKTLPQDPTQNYTWTFFDNQSRTLSGMIANYTFDWPCTCLVTLTVTNSAGSATATMGITVKDITPPVAVITVDGYPSGQNIPVGTLVYFYSNQSYDPYNLTLTGHNWDFGDGTGHSDFDNTGYTYSNSGTYTVSLTIHNSAGYSSTATKNVVVGDGVSDTSSPNPDQTSSPSDTSTSSTPHPSNQDNGKSNAQASLTLPPAMQYTLIFVTVFVLGGSAFWLRKKA
jgi:PKD repeat protein